MKLGSTDISKIYLGSTEVGNAYLGSVQVHGGTTPILPYDAEVEYLAQNENNTAYIDTGFVDNGQYSFVSYVSYVFPTSNYKYGFIYGYSSGWYSKARTSRVQNDGGTKRHYIWYNNTEQKVDLSSTDIAIADLPASYKVDGSVLWSHSSANISNSLSVYLFGRNYNGTLNPGNFNSQLKYKKFKIFNGDTLLMDMIPVRVGQVGYMYDKVSKQLFGNAGTGSFVLGNDVTN